MGSLDRLALSEVNYMSTETSNRKRVFKAVFLNKKECDPVTRKRKAVAISADKSIDVARSASFAVKYLGRE